MTAFIQAKSRVAPHVLAALTAALIGVAVISVAGQIQVSALHDAAHDVRHATGFPCH